MIWRTAVGAWIGGSAIPFFSTSAALTAASLVGPEAPWSFGALPPEAAPVGRLSGAGSSSVGSAATAAVSPATGSTTFARLLRVGSGSVALARGVLGAPSLAGACAPDGSCGLPEDPDAMTTSATTTAATTDATTSLRDTTLSMPDI